MKFIEAKKFAEDYINFISACKTERETVSFALGLAENFGFDNLDFANGSETVLLPGRKLFYNFAGKSAVFFVLGTRPISDGLNILAAHIDTCRLDLKQNPLYEDSGLALLDTHYYGGIKKYQWATIPLELRGVVYKPDGREIKISVGANEAEPVFCVSDLLIHLAKEQMKKDAEKVVTGENLDVLCGCSSDEKNSVKEKILGLLKTRYDLTEADFISADLSFVPAGRARSSGFDETLVAGYGQDDRVCAFAALQAILHCENPVRSACVILADKEEIGSYGASGMRAKFFENALAEVMNLTGDYSELKLRRALQNSSALSCDVSSAYDPLYKDVFDKKNSSYLGRGVVFNKFTGARGKSGASEADSKYVARIRKLLDDAGVKYQFAELGKVDAGGGGTVAHMLADYSMNVIDAGVSVMSMHAPTEVTSKFDIYESFRAYKVFLDDLK